MTYVSDFRQAKPWSGIRQVLSSEELSLSFEEIDTAENLFWKALSSDFSIDEALDEVFLQLEVAPELQSALRLVFDQAILDSRPRITIRRHASTPQITVMS